MLFKHVSLMRVFFSVPSMDTI